MCSVFQSKHFCIGQKGIKCSFPNLRSQKEKKFFGIGDDDRPEKYPNKTRKSLFFTFSVYFQFIWCLIRPFEDRQKRMERKKIRTLKSYVLYSFFFSLLSFLLLVLLLFSIRTLKIFAVVTVNCPWTSTWVDDFSGIFFLVNLFFFCSFVISIEPSILSFKIGYLEWYRTKTKPIQQYRFALCNKFIHCLDLISLFFPPIISHHVRFRW